MIQFVLKGISPFVQVHSPPDRERWSMGGIDKPSPISSSWQEVSEGDLELEGEDHLMEEEDTHLLKCR